MADIDPHAKHVHEFTFWKVITGQGEGAIFEVVEVNDTNPVEAGYAMIRLLGQAQKTRVPLDDRWETGFEKITACPDCQEPLPSHLVTCKYALMEVRTAGPPEQQAEEFLDEIVGPEKRVEIAPPAEEVQTGVESHQTMGDVVDQVKTSEFPDSYTLRRCMICHKQVLFMYENDRIVYQWMCEHEGEMQVVVVRHPVETRERLEALLEECQEMLGEMENGSWTDDKVRLECARALVHLKDTEWGEL